MGSVVLVSFFMLPDLLLRCLVIQKTFEDKYASANPRSSTESCKPHLCVLLVEVAEALADVCFVLMLARMYQQLGCWGTYIRKEHVLEMERNQQT